MVDVITKLKSLLNYIFTNIQIHTLNSVILLIDERNTQDLYTYRMLTIISINEI